MERKIATFGIIYFIIGLIFATAYAFFYHWPPLSFLSPGFYAVTVSWPFQLSGFISDFRSYGFAGKILT